MRRTLRRVVVVSFLAWPGLVAGQSLTGSIIGTVHDPQGGALQGASVSVHAPTLLGGVQAMTTSDDGHLRLATLPPGVYTLDVQAPGFAAYHEEGLRIGVGTTIERRIVLRLASLTESLIVHEAGASLDARNSGFETRLSAEEMQRIPVRRFSMFDVIRAAPGMSPTSPSSGSINSVSSFGSGANENAFLIDGTIYTCPCSGEARSEPGVDFIQEVQVQSVGASAEFGNLQGGVINVITRQGSDRFVLDGAYYWQTAGLTDQPVTLRIGSSASTSGYARVRYNDMTSSLGGPIARGRAWFFGGYQYLRDYDSQPGTDPAFPRTYEQDKLFAKLTWRFSPSLQLVQSYHHEWWVNPELPTRVKPFEATQRRHASVPAVTVGHLTHTVTSKTLWDVRAGHFDYDRHDDPSTGLTTIAGHTDRLTGVASGAPQSFGGLRLIRTTGKASIDHYRPGLGGATHQLRAGGQLERGEHRLSTIIPTGVRYVDTGTQPFQSIASDPSINGGVFVTVAGFVSDAITLGPRLTVNAGVRFDHSRAISQDLHALDAQGHATDTVIEGLGTLYTWNVWSPRLGATLRLSGDGRTMLRASSGRFHQGVLTGELSPFHPATASVTTRAFDTVTGDYTTLVSVVNPGTNLTYDPGTRAPHTDEYSVGIDRLVASRFSLAAAYVHKRGRDFVGWHDIGGTYHQETQSLPDGRALSVFVLDGPTATRRFQLTNPDGFGLNYHGMVVAAEKRYSQGWQAFGSYTFARSTGLQVSSGAAAASAQVSTIAGTPFLTFGQDPNSQTNARGRLPNDRPHMLRAMGSVEIPGIKVRLAASLQHFSGKPWAASAQVSLPQGDQRILIEPAGWRRLPSQTLLDLRISQPIRIGGMTRLELLVDVLNALNVTGPEAIASDNAFSSNFGQPAVFVDPRRAMIGVRLGLGH